MNFRTNDNVPCKGCTKETGRSVEPNCHEYCTKFLTYNEEKEKKKQLIRQNKKIDSDYFGVRHAGSEKIFNTQKKYK